MDHSSALAAQLARVEETRAQVGAAGPYHAGPSTGRCETVEGGDWCGGRWAECLRIAGRLLGRPELIQEALRPRQEKDDQFCGHRFYCSAAPLQSEIGDPALRMLALAAAYSVRAMAMPQNGAMPIGHEVQVKSTTLASRRIVAVDNAHPNVRLDYWAVAGTGDPVFRKGAVWPSAPDRSPGGWLFQSAAPICQPLRADPGQRLPADGAMLPGRRQGGLLRKGAS